MYIYIYIYHSKMAKEESREEVEGIINNEEPIRSSNRNNYRRRRS